MGTLLRKPSELQVQEAIKILIYGQPGVGKTTLALSAPEPALIDFDEGVHRVNALHQVPTLQVKSYDDFLKLIASNEIKPFASLVVDTAGKMLDYMGDYLIKNNPKLGRRDGSLTLQGYGARKVEFNRVLRYVSLLGKHLVFVAHDREDKDGDVRTIRPEIGGSSTGDLIRELDLVGYMEMIDKRITISFNPCERYYGKNTCGLAPLIEVPMLLDAKGAPIADNVLLTDIFNKYHANLSARKDVSLRYNKLINSISRGVEGASTPEALNEVVTSIAEAEHIWDSSLIARRLVTDRAKDLGFVFCPNTKQYKQYKADDEPKEGAKKALKATKAEAEGTAEKEEE